MEHLKASSSPIPFSGAAWFDPLEEAVHFQVRGFIEAMVEAELRAAPPPLRDLIDDPRDGAEQYDRRPLRP